eukprot:Gb_27169 [translate_table: standard]
MLFVMSNPRRPRMKVHDYLEGGKLRLILKKWRIRRHGWSKSLNSGCSLPALTALSRSRTWYPFSNINSDEEWDDDDYGQRARASAPMTPEGHFAVYVGQERKRFVIKTEHVNHPLFKMLLDEAEKEYGFENEGPLALPCQVAFFHKILRMLNRNHGCADESTVMEVFKMYSKR